MKSTDHCDQESSIEKSASLDGKSIAKPRYYGPRQLDSGAIASPKETITVFIPLAMGPPSTAEAQKAFQVTYQPDRNSDAVQIPTEWQIGIPIQIPGNSLLAVRDGAFCCQMVQYDWRPAETHEEEGVV